MKLRWRPSPGASVFHAAALLCDGRALARAELAEALAAPTAALRAMLAAQGIVAERFFAHLVPLSAGIASPRELARVALTKTSGTPRTSESLASVADALREVQRAAHSVLGDLAAELPLRQGPLEGQWEARGPGLLAGVARLTEAELLVDEAEVLLVYPALGGGGAAHPLYNAVRLEAVLANPAAELPEVLRLGWLVAQLNFTLPRYADRLHRDELLRVGPLALVPIVLEAAEQVELARCDVPTLQLALNVWGLPLADRPSTVERLDQWWHTYAESRPPFATALVALERMLDEA